MKKIVIALVIILILGVVIAIVGINKHTEQEGPNVIIDIANNNDNFNEENAYVKRVTLTAEESYLYDSEDWISGDSSNLSTYLKNIDYSKIARKDESKELVYEKTYKYIFHGGDWENIIPVVNINSDDAENINNTIESVMSDCYGIEYKFKIENETLSLIIQEDHEESTTYAIYKINMYTGKID